MEIHEPKSSSFREILRHYLGDIVYGGNDGIITTFAVISGVAGAKLSLEAMFVITVVNLLADGLSMASSNYLAIRSQAEAQGISRGQVEPTLHALATFISFILFGAMPLLGFIAVDLIPVEPFILSATVTACTMFVLGMLRASVTMRKWYTAGMENLIIGAIASIIAFYCGKFMATVV